MADPDQTRGPFSRLPRLESARHRAEWLLRGRSRQREVESGVAGPTTYGTDKPSGFSRSANRRTSGWLRGCWRPVGRGRKSSWCVRFHCAEDPGGRGGRNGSSSACQQRNSRADFPQPFTAGQRTPMQPAVRRLHPQGPSQLDELFPVGHGLELVRRHSAITVV